jgi:hypothetical protein
MINENAGSRNVIRPTVTSPPALSDNVDDIVDYMRHIGDLSRTGPQQRGRWGLDRGAA